MQKYAFRQMRVGVGHTLVLPAVEANSIGMKDICAFFTVAPSFLRRNDLPSMNAKKLPQYPVPVFLLAQLAVHTECQGRGLGKITLIRALEHLLRVQSVLPAYAIIVDCLNDSAEHFYMQFGFRKLTGSYKRTRLFLPMNTVDQLFNKGLKSILEPVNRSS
ncbi:MAG: GNAT family N-acetyltransferase [Candidatus Sabulitectum sp.]|nr:GNAT family N-acetyltransferase [Candidatus Sabulitectum sp.]